MPTIIHVERRSVEGKTRPFLCRADDGKSYWAKGYGAGKAALCREWIAGRLGQEFGLPIPPFAQASVSQDLMDYSAMPDIEDLGIGLVFASEEVPGIEDFAYCHIRHTDSILRQRILLFDWWVRNQDRILSPQGGNPNLLWQASQHRLHVIDHNCAFDNDFQKDAFREMHVFSAEFAILDHQFLLETEAKFKDIARRFDVIANELPEEWREGLELSAANTLDTMKRLIEQVDLVRDMGRGPTI